MCSISGFVSSKPLHAATARRLCSALAQYGSERGSQSTGIFTNGRLLKRACAPMEFVDGSDFHNLFEDGASYALIHTRFPTSGGRGDAQAQPFVADSGNTISCHNGYFFDCKGIKAEWEIDKPSGVDSELACSFVDKYGIRKLPKFIESVDGAAALVVLHQKKLYAMRSGNPLWYQFITLENGTDICIFGSTMPLVEHACRYAWVVRTLNARSLDEGYLFRLEPNRIVQLGKKTERKKAAVQVYRSNYDYEDHGYGAGSRKESYKPAGSFHGTKFIDGKETWGSWSGEVFTPYPDQKYWRGTKNWRDNSGPTLPDSMAHLNRKRDIEEAMSKIEEELEEGEKQSEAVAEDKKETKQ